jgi:multiple antibiotic resistance protein
MSQVDLTVNFFVALFALIDPIGTIPVFAAATAGAPTPRARARIALYLSLFIVAFLTFFYFSGMALLEFFGISMPAFRIAGGILLFLLGLDMARENFAESFADSADATHDPGDWRGYARRRFERLIVPFAMPLLIGPGAISTVIVYASETARFGPSGWAWGFGAIVAVATVTFVAFSFTGLISRLLRPVGLAIVVRVLGLILCALAVQLILAGVADSTRDLIDYGATGLRAR